MSARLNMDVVYLNYETMTPNTPNRPDEPRSPEPPTDPQRRQELNRTTSRQFIISVSIGIVVIIAGVAIAYTKFTGS